MGPSGEESSAQTVRRISGCARGVPPIRGSCGPPQLREGAGVEIRVARTAEPRRPAAGPLRHTEPPSSAAVPRRAEPPGSAPAPCPPEGRRAVPSGGNRPPPAITSRRPPPPAPVTAKMAAPGGGAEGRGDPA